jgi:hypothetical protein
MISPGKAKNKVQQQEARAARLSAALRENLKRRKVQARGRAESRAADESPAAGPQTPDFRRNPGRE